MAKTKTVAINKNYNNALKYIKATANIQGAPKLAYVETIQKYLGKNGKPLAHKLKSRKAREEFNEAVRTFNKMRPSAKDAKTIAKKGMTYADIARSASAKHSRLMQAIRDEAINLLKTNAEIGSDIINRLASDDSISTDDFYRTIDMISERLNNLPESAKADAMMDDVYSIIDSMHNDFDAEHFRQMMNVKVDSDIALINEGASLLKEMGVNPEGIDMLKLGKAYEDAMSANPEGLSVDAIKEILEEIRNGF